MHLSGNDDEVTRWKRGKKMVDSKEACNEALKIVAEAATSFSCVIVVAESVEDSWDLAVTEAAMVKRMLASSFGKDANETNAFVIMWIQ